MYTFIEDNPGNETMYLQIKEQLPEQPAGLVAQVVLQREGGQRIVAVWETEAHWIAFRDEHVEPAVGAMLASYGLPHDESAEHVEEYTVIDVMVGAAANAPTA